MKRLAGRKIVCGILSGAIGMDLSGVINKSHPTGTTND
tara:strand:- start:998 stop:1111 length:114 start_codon:yes stop_codon:yes gene_type:complete